MNLKPLSQWGRKEKKREWKKLNKKGSFLDIFLILVIIAISGVIFIVASKMANDLNEKIRPLGSSLNPYQQQIFNKTLNNSNNVANNFDNIFLFLYVGLMIVLFITAFLVEEPAVFMVIWFIMLLIAVFISIPMSQFYGNLTATSAYASTATRFPMQNFVFSILPILTFMMGLIALIMNYAKSRFGGQL